MAAKENPPTVAFTHTKSRNRQSMVLEGSILFSSTHAPLIFLSYHMWCEWFSPLWSQGGCWTSTCQVSPFSRWEKRKNIKEKGKGFSPHDHLRFYFLMIIFLKDFCVELVIWPPLAARVAEESSIFFSRFNSRGK